MDYGIQANIWGRIRVQVRRYITAARRLWWLLPLTVSLGLCIASWIVAQMPPEYESTGTMVYEGQYQLSTGGAVYDEQLTNYFGTQIQLMLSSRVQQEALTQVQTLHPDLKVEAPDYKVIQAPEAAMLLMKVTAHSAQFAQAYLDACMHAYLDEKRQLREDLSNGTTIGLSKEMDRLNEVIEQNEAEMLAFQKANNVGFLQEEGNSAAKYLDQLQQQLAALQSNYNLLNMLSLDQTLDREQNATSPMPAAGGTTAAPDGGTGAPDANRIDTALTTSGPIADYQRARQQLALYKAQLVDLSHRLKPKHPDIIALNQEIQHEQDLLDTLRAQSEEAFQTHREDLAVQIKELQDEIKKQQANALVLSGTLAQYDQIKTKGDRAKAEYDRLLANFHSVDVGKNVDQDPLTILEPASPAISVKPGLFRILGAGLGGGLLVGLLILIVLDQTDDRISSLIELQTHFPDQQLLGQIPEEKLTGENALLRSDDDRQSLLESFRTLRSSIIFLPIEGKRPKTFVVTSALPDEGKTTVTSNLAVTLAFSGARTLIVDADLRRGQVSNVFGAVNCNGFSSVLLGRKAWRDCVYSTSIENLYIMPCGPALQHTSEHLLGKVTDRFLVDIYDQFDYVVFDSPPVIILDDTLCLAPKIDATLFVLRFGNSSVRPSRRALELLLHRQVNVIGLVCNGVSVAETEYNYNYNYRQYGDRYAEVKESAPEFSNGHAESKPRIKSNKPKPKPTTRT